MIGTMIIITPTRQTIIRKVPLPAVIKCYAVVLGTATVMFCALLIATAVVPVIISAVLAFVASAHALNSVFLIAELL